MEYETFLTKKVIIIYRLYHRNYQLIWYWLLIFKGFSGVYKGLIPTVIKQGSNQAIRFFCMETLKSEYRKYKRIDPNSPVPILVTGLFGVIAGAASVFGNTPADVVKTRMQVNLIKYNYIYLSKYVI